jgi:hypothetical protein
MSLPGPPRRIARLVGYVMMAAGGGVAFAIPVRSIESKTGWLVYLWAAFLLIGGLACAYGAVTDRWIGELVGLPLISSAFGVYFVVLGLAFTIPGAAIALVFGAIALILLARWRDISRVRQEADRANQHRPREVQ